MEIENVHIHQSETFTDLNYPKNKAILIMEGLHDS